MYIETVKVKKKGRVYYYNRLCEYSDGIRLRHRLTPRGNVYMYILGRKCMERRLMGEPVQKGTILLPKGKRPGRPRAFTKEQAEKYIAAGYSVRGRKLQQNRKTFYTIETARIRFGMFNEHERGQIGSPSSLLKIEKRARSIYNCMKVQGGGMTLNEALEYAIDEFFDSK